MADALPFSTTIEVRDNCLCLHAQRAARALARRYDEALKPYGLTNGQFSLLMSVNRPGRPSMSAVAATLGMDRTTLTAMLKPLVRRGLLTVTLDEADRRNRILALTAEGRSALVAALPVWRATQGEVETLLDEQSADEFRAGLRAVCG